MKVLQIATTTAGGAGIAARRLNAALNSLGVDSILITGAHKELPKNPFEIVVKKRILNRNLSRFATVFQAKFVQRKNLLVTPISLGVISAEEILKRKPDIIHMHSFYNLLNMKTISDICDSDIPIFITLHDERFFTGGCHHSLHCLNFEDTCTNCHETNDLFSNIVVRAQYNLGQAIKRSSELTVITPSNWIGTRARSSKILEFAEFFQVNNPLSLEFIQKSEIPKKEKEIFDPYIVTFVAQDLRSPYKGIETLLNCIGKYEKEFSSQNIQFTFVGQGSEIEIGELKARQYGKIDSIELIDVFYESDLLIVPSLIDNSPNVIFEALACGTPFIGSNKGGIPEISKAFGMETFVYGDSDSMYQAIIKQKGSKAEPSTIRQAALEMVHPEAVAQKILALYAMKSTDAS